MCFTMAQENDLRLVIPFIINKQKILQIAVEIIRIELIKNVDHFLYIYISISLIPYGIGREIPLPRFLHINNSLHAISQAPETLDAIFGEHPTIQIMVYRSWSRLVPIPFHILVVSVQLIVDSYSFNMPITILYT